jgi:hypothetical protein
MDGFTTLICCFLLMCEDSEFASFAYLPIYNLSGTVRDHSTGATLSWLGRRLGSQEAVSEGAMGAAHLEPLPAAGSDLLRTDLTQALPLFGSMREGILCDQLKNASFSLLLPQLGYLPVVHRAVMEPDCRAKLSAA